MLLHPAIAVSGFAGLGAAASGPTVADELPAPVRVCADLLQRFAAVSDGRRDQGRVHPVAVVLALCAAAVVAGMASFTAIAGWAGDVPAELLVKLYGQPSAAPSKATIWRVVTGSDATAVDAVIGACLLAHDTARDTTTPDPAQDTSGRVAIMVDGKAVRGATDAECNQVHLLAAATHGDALVLGQVEVGAKGNEIPQFAPLLATLWGERQWRRRRAGLHRSETTTKAWARIRGYISTVVKHGHNIYDALRSAVTGNPWKPPATRCPEWLHPHDTGILP